MLRWLTALFTLLALAAPARANLADPILHGDPTGEPRGMAGMAIARERLDLDLHAVGDDGLAHVAASYRVINRGDAQQLALVFVTGSREVHDFAISLDGAPIDTQPYHGRLPDNWQAPAATPGFDGERAWGYYPDRDAAALAFTMFVSRGDHVIAATYTAVAVVHRRDDDTATKVYQLAYVLAPARSWDSFGGLDATIEVPADWQVAVTPAFARDGDTLRAKFDALPADAIAISVRARAGVAFRALEIATRLTLLFVVLAGPVVLALRATRRARAGRSAGGVLGGLLWAVAIVGVGLVAIFVPDDVLPVHEVIGHGYDLAAEALNLVIGALFAWLIRAIVAVLFARRARRA